MRSLGDSAFLDQNNQLYIEVDSTPDAFDPPGYQPPRVLKPTGFTFEDVPTYGLLGMFWHNNPLQFATEQTAEKIKSIILMNSGGHVARIDHDMEEVLVGPFRRAACRKLLLWGNNAIATSINAGEAASQYARYPQKFIDRIKDAMK